MNPTRKDFSAPIKIVFCNFCKLRSGVCGSICHHACTCNSVVIWQLRTDEERALVMEGQSWRTKPQLPAPGQPTSTCWQRAASAAHSSASPSATARAIVSATSQTTGCTSALPTGNLLCKVCGSTKLKNGRSGSPARKRLLLLMKCRRFLCDPMLSVCGRLSDSLHVW